MGMPQMGDFAGFMKQMMKREDRPYEVIAQLSEEQKKEWEECQQMLKEANMIIEEAQARKDLLWARIRRALDPADNERETLKIEDGILWGTIDTPKEQSRFQVEPPMLLEE